jgi:hypothetical protein
MQYTLYPHCPDLPTSSQSNKLEPVQDLPAKYHLRSLLNNIMTSPLDIFRRQFPIRQ